MGVPAGRALCHASQSSARTTAELCAGGWLQLPWAWELHCPSHLLSIHFPATKPWGCSSTADFAASLHCFLGSTYPGAPSTHSMLRTEAKMGTAAPCQPVTTKSSHQPCGSGCVEGFGHWEKPACDLQPCGSVPSRLPAGWEAAGTRWSTAGLVSWGKLLVAWVKSSSGAGMEPDEAGHATGFISITGCKPQLLTCKQK